MHPTDLCHPLSHISCFSRFIVINDAVLRLNCDKKCWLLDFVLCRNYALLSFYISSFCSIATKPHFQSTKDYLCWCIRHSCYPQSESRRHFFIASEMLPNNSSMLPYRFESCGCCCCVSVMAFAIFAAVQPGVFLI